MGKFGFGGFSKASLFGGRGHGRNKHDRDEDRDDDDDRHGHGHSKGQHDTGCNTGSGGGNGGNGGGVVNTNNFADIPDDTTGVTFTIDVGRNGSDDDYYVVRAPQGVDPATLTMQSYYDTVAEDIAAKYPNTPPGQIVVKATIYSASQGQSYQYFDGNEKTTAELNAGNTDDDNDDHHGGDKDDDGHHGGGHHGGWNKAKWGKKLDRDDDRDNDDDHKDDKDSSCDRGDKGDKGHGGHDFGKFFANLMAHGDAPSEDDHGSNEDEDEKDHSDDLIFC